MLYNTLAHDLTAPCIILAAVLALAAGLGLGYFLLVKMHEKSLAESKKRIEDAEAKAKDEIEQFKKE